MMRMIFAPEARREFEEAERYYNRQAPRLGDEFRAEIKSALPRIQAWPLSCPVERGDIRRLTLSRFPYKLCCTRLKATTSTSSLSPTSTASPSIGLIGDLTNETQGLANSKNQNSRGCLSFFCNFSCTNKLGRCSKFFLIF